MRIFYRESLPGPVLPPTGQSILLLHGQAFSSETWQRPELPTIQTMSTLGHRVVAVDLPGYGQSEPLPKGKLHAGFLAKVIETLFGNDAKNVRTCMAICWREWDMPNFSL